LHAPVQQLTLVAHASLGCPQNDDAWQVPLGAQYAEQHWLAAVHLFPTVAHVVLSVPHLPPVHV
jgi:hypothetical protein